SSSAVESSQPIPPTAPAYDQAIGAPRTPGALDGRYGAGAVAAASGMGGGGARDLAGDGGNAGKHRSAEGGGCRAAGRRARADAGGPLPPPAGGDPGFERGWRGGAAPPARA